MESGGNTHTSSLCPACSHCRCSPPIGPLVAISTPDRLSYLMLVFESLSRDLIMALQRTHSDADNSDVLKRSCEVIPSSEKMSTEREKRCADRARCYSWVQGCPVDSGDDCVVPPFRIRRCFMRTQVLLFMCLVVQMAVQQRL